MRRIDVPSAVTAMPAVPAADAEGWFTNGNPIAGQAATQVPDWWLNMVQAELEAVVLGGGIAKNKTSMNQMYLAMQNLFGSQIYCFGASQNFACPVGKDRAIVFLWGAGGGGGGSNGPAASGSGGGGGEFRLGVVSGLSGQNIAVTVGAAGAGGAGGGSPTNGNNGAWSTFNGAITAAGGTHGFGASNAVQQTFAGSGGAGGSGGAMVISGRGGGYGILTSGSNLFGGIGGSSFMTGYNTLTSGGAGAGGMACGQGGNGGTYGGGGGAGGSGFCIALFT